MKKSMNVLLSSLVVLSMFSACSPTIYSSVGHNSPMFTEKGEVVFNASHASVDVGPAISGGGDTGKGIALQAAYSISNKLAAIGSFYSMGNTGTRDKDEWSSQGNYGEIGFGLYGTGPSKKFGYEIYGGMGTGSIKNKLDNKEHMDLTFIKPFVQPSVGFLSRYFDILFTPRLAMLSLREQSFLFQDESYSLSARRFFDQSNNSVVFEPGITIRAGYENLKLQLQYAYTTFQPKNLENGTVQQDFFSIGIHILISKRYMQNQ
ncbi:hypothetical protein [Pararhodonellum marinum]|uniref:hypothetical protein n=1 Tax=Pararhodonellum marinum TaxID=2755358 RepID=UPI00188E1D74|nr:hypothetical protein [Pararhodonellum marinum]